MTQVVIYQPANEREREIARCIALGYSWSETAKLAKCSMRTVSRSLDKLRPFIDEIRINFESEFERSMYQNLGLAMEIERRMLAGEIEAKDPRYLEAKEIVTRVRNRLFAVESRQAQDRPSIPPAPPPFLLPGPAGSASGEPGGA